MTLGNRQERIAQERQRADYIAITTASSVFAPAGIFTPMIAILDSAPVIANQPEPMCWGALIAFHAADVVVALRCAAVLLGSTC